VIAALSLTPLVATRTKAQLALSQTLSRPHDDPDGDNEAPYVPSGTVAGLGVTGATKQWVRNSQLSTQLSGSLRKSGILHLESVYSLTENSYLRLVPNVFLNQQLLKFFVE
jgi:hypothetical protein